MDSFSNHLRTQPVRDAVLAVVLAAFVLAALDRLLVELARAERGEATQLDLSLELTAFAADFARDLREASAESFFCQGAVCSLPAANGGVATYQSACNQAPTLFAHLSRDESRLGACLSRCPDGELPEVLMRRGGEVRRYSPRLPGSGVIAGSVCFDEHDGVVTAEVSTLTVRGDRIARARHELRFERSP